MAFNPTAKFVQGEPLMVDFTPTANKLAGAVEVVAQGVRIVHTDIAANRQGAYSAGYGVYDIPKATTNAYADGLAIGWDADNQVGLELSGQYPVFGRLIGAAAETDPTMRVLHLPQGVTYLGS